MMADSEATGSYMAANVPEQPNLVKKTMRPKLRPWHAARKREALMLLPEARRLE